MVDRYSGFVHWATHYFFTRKLWRSGHQVSILTHSLHCWELLLARGNIMKVRVKLGLSALSASLVGCLVGALSSSAATWKWPVSYTASRIAWSHEEPKPLPFGTIYERDTKNFAGIDARAFLGSTGWALGWDDARGTQYALVTHNHGRTWTTAGTYLSISGAAGAAVNTVRAFTPKIVAAYDSGGGMNVFDITWNGGRTWYSAWVPGNLISVSNAVRSMDKSPAGVIQLVVASLSHPTTYRLYTSTNSGRSWGESLKFGR